MTRARATPRGPSANTPSQVAARRSDRGAWRHERGAACPRQRVSAAPSLRRFSVRLPLRHRAAVGVRRGCGEALRVLAGHHGASLRRNEARARKLRSAHYTRRRGCAARTGRAADTYSHEPPAQPTVDAARAGRGQGGAQGAYSASRCVLGRLVTAQTARSTHLAFLSSGRPHKTALWRAWTPCRSARSARVRSAGKRTVGQAEQDSAHGKRVACDEARASGGGRRVRRRPLARAHSRPGAPPQSFGRRFALSPLQSKRLPLLRPASTPGWCSCGSWLVRQAAAVPWGARRLCNAPQQGGGP